MFLLLVIALIVVCCCAGDNDTIRYTNQLYSNSFGAPGENATFDYVVVGGGTAGNTIAARLAETPGTIVAVIEAGGFYDIDDGNLSVVPAYCFLGTGSDIADIFPYVDWSFVTTPQQGLNHRSLHYDRGKTLGGSSARNYVAYQRPTVDSLQMWADQVGDQSYTFDRMLPYYKKSTHFTPPDFTRRDTNIALNYDPKVFHNTRGGPLAVSYANYASLTASWFQIALTRAGVAINNGFNSGSLFGSQRSTSTIYPATSRR